MNDKPKTSVDKSAETQITAKIKSLSNILVTVSRDPSVDQLAAALALTLALDKMEKHATAVFSGVIPPAINFLEPEKTFENNADGLRDFIISLDKQKADRLRFKVDGDIVKVLITPYRTTISEADLSFSEGEFNVELVIAVGVDKKEDLDAAIAAHGRIFHDAAVATITIDTEKGSLGSINWQKPEASSFSEMAASLIVSLDTKEKPLLDEQTATSLLTGIVAATDQFRNEKTSSSVMTLAANLMAKGANQQLISSELAAATEGLDLASRTVGAVSGEDNGNELALNHAENVAINETSPPPTESTQTIETGVAERPVTAATMNDMVETETRRLAEQRSADALAVAESQLTEASLSPKPEITPVTPTDPSETALDNVVAANAAQPILDDLSTTVNTVDDGSQLSHGMPYVEERITNPLTAATQLDETPLESVASAPLSHVGDIATASPISPMIDTNPSLTTAKLPSPAPAPITQPTLSSDITPLEGLPSDDLAAALSAAQPAETTAGQVTDAQTVAAELPSPAGVFTEATTVDTTMPPLPPANFDLPLPPPPPLPLPDLGTLPPSSTVPTFDLPPVPTAVSPAPEPAMASIPGDSGLFPSVNTAPDDPAQYRIPGQ